MNICDHRAPTAANRASSAQAAPQAVKMWTVKAMARNVVGFLGELTGSIAASHNPAVIGNVPELNRNRVSNGWR
jgi:hypothetical protein